MATKTINRSDKFKALLDKLHSDATPRQSSCDQSLNELRNAVKQLREQQSKQDEEDEAEDSAQNSTNSSESSLSDASGTFQMGVTTKTGSSNNRSGKKVKKK
jgi:hypothetical protein